MDKLGDLWKEIKENCKEQRLELFLMFLFVVAVFGMSMDELSKARAVSGPGAEAETGEMLQTDEAVPGTEEDTEREPGTETETERDTEGELFSGPLEYSTLMDMRRLRGYEVTPPKGPFPYGTALAPEGGETEREGVSAVPLEEALQEKIEGYDGDWSVYAKNLSTGEEAIVGDRPMKSASVMKLFIMGTVYKAFEEGELERTDEIMSLMNDMISYSDNTDSNQLLYDLGGSNYARGIAKVNEFIRENGFSNMTVEYNGFNDPATNTSEDSYNQVSAKDCGRLLESIYHREWVSRSVSNEIEQMMLNQNTRYKIPAGLPEGISCGNKTGEMDTTENDAAIVYGNHCDYILVVLSSDWNSKDEAVSRIQSISAQVYEYFDERG